MSGGNRKPVIIGVTGGFGTGKTTVAGIFKILGAKVLDADKLAHKALKKGTDSYQKIVSAFGRGILGGFNRIDRVKLACAVFQNRKALDKLCTIVHPIVVGEIAESIKKISSSENAPAVVIDAPLLIEARLHTIVDYLVCVKTSRTTQVERVMKKTHLSANQIIRRIKNQMPLRKKIEMADYVINNEGSKNDTGKIVRKIWREISETITPHPDTA